MNSKPLPHTGFLRLHDIIGSPKAVPPVPAIIPVSKSTWWAGIKTGRYPQPVKLGPRITAWRVEDIRQLIQESSCGRNEADPMMDGQGGQNELDKNHV